MDNLLLETPIQFDLFSPAEDKERSQSKDPPEVLVIFFYYYCIYID